MTNITCWVNECPLPIGKWGMCEGHRALWEQEHPRKNAYLPEDLATKFDFYAEKDSSRCSDWRSLLPGCWHWSGALSDHGYGTLGIPTKDIVPGGAKMIRAHRLSHELFKGPVPEGFEVDHLCRVRPCVRPDHLEAVPGVVNNLRGTGPAAINAAKLVCPQGHEYDGLGSDGARTCSKCIKGHSKGRNTGVGSGGYQTDRTHCPKNHEYSGDNLIIEKRKKSDGSYGEVRKCRTCVAAVRAARNARKRG